MLLIIWIPYGLSMESHGVENDKQWVTGTWW